MQSCGAGSSRSACAWRCGLRRDRRKVSIATFELPGDEKPRKRKSLSERMRCFTRRFHFSNLGLVVIDEQHKFGVAQRARLTAREPAPDVLVMTATPIPRTLTMTVYGDLDVSIIDEMPRNRGKVITAVRDVSKLGEVLSFFARHNWKPGDNSM